jgi:hypothetical protein
MLKTIKNIELSSTKYRITENIIIENIYQNPIRSKNKITLLDTETGEQIKQTKQRAKTNEINVQNWQKSKSKLIDLVNANIDNKTYFLTLTYNNKNPRKKDDYDKLKQDWKNFQQRYKRENTEPLTFIMVQELQNKNKRGVWHIHALLFNQKNIDVKNWRKYWGNGAIRIEYVHTISPKVAFYFSKYLFKDMQFLPHKQKYSTSKNLIKPTTVYQTPDLTNYELVSTQNYISDWTGESIKNIYIKKQKTTKKH